MPLYLITPKSSRTAAAIVRARNGNAAADLVDFKVKEIDRLSDAGAAAVLCRVSSPAFVEAVEETPAAAADEEAWADRTTLETPAGYVDEVNTTTGEERRRPTASAD